jgi:DNA repair exonuclease SbcCD ATPase subunit
MRKYYTFLVIGETGSGKTTLLDAFVNKLTAMKLTDNWRWKLADESHLNMK